MRYNYIVIAKMNNIIEQAEVCCGEEDAKETAQRYRNWGYRVVILQSIDCENIVFK